MKSNIDLNKVLAKAKLYRAIENKIPRTYLEQYNSAFEVDYAHNSTAIEGNTLSLIETKLLLEDKISIGGKELREIYEVVNHQKAFSFVKEKIANGEPLDEEIVKEIHHLLTENIFVGGIYRNSPARITGASFRPPYGEEMLRDMKYFYVDFSWKRNSNPIEYAAWTHAEFVRIHPFPDGNGRTSRMIMNYQLMSYGLLPISIQAKDRLEYYQALDFYAVNKDITEFANFITERENAILDEYLELSKSLNIISDLDITTFVCNELKEKSVQTKKQDGRQL